MDYNECKKIALSLNHNITICREYKKAYHFLNPDLDITGDNGVVVIKSTGKAISWVDFILKYNPEKNPKEVEL